MRYASNSSQYYLNIGYILLLSEMMLQSAQPIPPLTANTAAAMSYIRPKYDHGISDSSKSEHFVDRLYRVTVYFFRLK